MKEEINCFTNRGKTAKNEWENDDSDFFSRFMQCILKISTILFPYFLINFIKERYISSVQLYLKKVISIQTMVSTFLKILVCAHNPFNKVIKF